MKAGYVLLITAVCLVAALVVTTSPAQSRVLTESEMRSTIGRIGDGCPCSELLEISCTGLVDQCTGKVCLSRPKNQGIPELGACSNGALYVWEHTGNTYHHCHAVPSPTKICHDGKDVKCSNWYACTSSDIIDDKKCNGIYNTCTATDTTMRCRHCVRGALSETIYATDQTCTSN